MPVAGKGEVLPAREVRDPFIADAAFPLHGKGFWGDVTQGLVHFDLRAATSDGDPAAVDFGFIELPRECQLDLGQMLKVRDERTTLTRTMARVGESIWFVCIDQAEQVADDVLTMWTLELPGERWKKEWEVSARELWGFDGFREAGLPDEAPEYPTTLSSRRTAPSSS